MSFGKKKDIENGQVQARLLQNKEKTLADNLLVLKRYEQLGEDKKIKFSKIISNSQLFFRSRKRAELHTSIFKQPPVTLQKLTENQIKQHAIISTLAANYAVVNHNIYHWTTLDNFKSIVDHKYFYGNSILKAKRIPFKENTLVDGDETNGDSKVICFCPFLVDYLALTQFKSLRSNLLRLTIDLNQIEKVGYYNKFFKLCDFLSPNFTYDIKINDQLSVTFEKVTMVGSKESLSDLAITLKFSGCKEVTVKLNKEESIFYGNLYSINYFCLTRLFYILEKIEDQSIKKAVNDYLLSCEEAEFKKILILFAQSLTLHSEYNINAALQLCPKLITEVYLANENRYVQLTNIPLDKYLQTIDAEKQATAELMPPILAFRKIRTITFFGVTIEDVNLLYHGIEIDPKGRSFRIERDFSNLSNRNFTGGHYLESRDPTLQYPENCEISKSKLIA